MQEMSAAYNEQKNKNVRNPVHVRITFGVIDPSAVEASTIANNGEMVYSDSDIIDLEQNSVTRRYGRLYENGFILDGSLYAAPESDYGYQGYVSSAVSDANAEFDTPPKFTITFDEYVSLAGLTIYFNADSGNFASEMVLNAYIDNELVGTETITNSEATLVWENTTISVDAVNGLEVSFTKTNFPYRDIAIDYLLFGVEKVFTGDNLESLDFVRDVDLVNSKLPTETLSFTFIDAAREYDPENPTGIWAYLDEEQEMVCEFGYELDDGSVEWAQMCNYYSTGDTSISNDVIPRVTFEGTSLLGYLTDDYIGGAYRAEGITYYALATEIMESLNLPLNADGTVKWRFDEEIMSAYTTYTPLSVMSVRECLQLIASACTCVLYTDRQGNIVIERHVLDFIATPSFRLSYDTIYEPPIIKKYPLLRDVIVTYSTVTVDSETTELYSDEITATETTAYQFSYSASTNQELTVDGLTIVGDPVFYAETCVVSLVGDGTVSITGNELIYTDKTETVSYNKVGDDCPVSLGLINTRAQAQDYAGFMYDYVKMRTEYEVTDRGYMELDPVDTIFAETSYGGYSGVVVAKTELSYSGALKGTTKYYQAVDYSQFVDNAVVTANGQTDYSTVENVFLPDAVIDVNYGRLYENGLILDGSSYGLPESSYQTQGYVSEVLSDSDGEFDVAPVVTITFERYVIAQNGLTLTFADENNFASEITINAYDGDTLIDTVTIENNSSVLLYTSVYPSTSSCNKMEFVFSKTNHPYRDIRLNNIYFGMK